MVLNPPPRGNRFLIKQSGIVALTTLQQTRLCPPLNWSVSGEADWSGAEPVPRTRRFCQTMLQHRSLSLSAKSGAKHAHE